jgi:hypothetical protein
MTMHTKIAVNVVEMTSASRDGLMALIKVVSGEGGFPSLESAYELEFEYGGGIIVMRSPAGIAHYLFKFKEAATAG